MRRIGHAPGVLPAAVLGTEDFDVTTVDIDSISLVYVAPLRSAIEDLDEDGFDDLTLKFDTQELLQAIEGSLPEEDGKPAELADGELITLFLTGKLLDGTSIIGEDDVVIKKKDGKG